MENFLIDVPMPSMGATVNELTVISVKTQPGDRVTRGQKLAELESDKSVFEFESPCDGIVRAVLVKAGDVKATGTLFLQIETADVSLRHLQSQGAGIRAFDSTGSQSVSADASRPLIWTPRATKLAQEAGLDPTKVTDIAATGPGGRVSGDDVALYLKARTSPDTS